MNCRQRRNTPNEGRPFRQFERDLWILEALAKMRFLTTTQLAHLFFNGSHWATHKRMRKLLDATLVRVWIRTLNDENLYSLNRAGARILEKSNGEICPSPRRLDANLEHLLGINHVRVSLVGGLPDVGGEILWWRSDWDLRDIGKKSLIPDSLFEIQWDGGTKQPYALEVDNLTRSAKRFLKKILTYESLKTHSRGFLGYSQFLILVVGREHQWIDRFRLMLNHARVRAQVWFTTFQNLEKQGAVHSIWLPSQGDQNTSLRDLSFLPYGKEGRPQNTSSFSKS